MSLRLAFEFFTADQQCNFGDKVKVRTKTSAEYIGLEAWRASHKAVSSVQAAEPLNGQVSNLHTADSAEIDCEKVIQLKGVMLPKHLFKYWWEALAAANEMKITDAAEATPPPPQAFQEIIEYLSFAGANFGNAVHSEACLACGKEGYLSWPRNGKCPSGELFPSLENLSRPVNCAAILNLGDNPVYCDITSVSVRDLEESLGKKEQGQSSPLSHKALIDSLTRSGIEFEMVRVRLDSREGLLCNEYFGTLGIYSEMAEELVAIASFIDYA